MHRKIPHSAIVFYAIAFLCLVFYLVYTFNLAITVSPIVRLVTLGFVCALGYFGSLKLCKHLPDNALKIMKTTFAVFFSLYVLLLVTLVLFDNYFGRTGLGLITDPHFQASEQYAHRSVNLKPFRTITNYIRGASYYSMRQLIINLFGNLIAFAPFAFFLPLLFKRMRNFALFILLIFSLVISVELLQYLLCTGQCDIDDIILNISGAAMAFWILKIKPIKKLFTKFTNPC